jgi:translocation and assembly module TamA
MIQNSASRYRLVQENMTALFLNQLKNKKNSLPDQGCMRNRPADLPGVAGPDDGADGGSGAAYLCRLTGLKTLSVLLTLAWLLLSTGLSAAESARPDIQINGLDSEQTNNVRAFLGLSNLKCDAADWRLQSALEKSPQEIAQALQALGYYSPSIQGGKLQRRGNCWSVAYQISAGSPVTIAQVDFTLLGEARDDRLFRKVVDEPPVKQGDSLNHGAYEEFKSALLSLAGRRGFFDARFTDHRLVIKPSSRQAWIHLTLDSGTRYHIGEVSYQVDALDEALVRRYQHFSEGEYYSTRKLNQFQQDLVASNYFENVVVHPLRDKARKVVNLRVELSGRKRHSYGVGLGLSTDAGPHANATYENRYLNERGHRFKAYGEVSTIGAKLITSYAVPLDDPTKEWLTFSGQYEQEETDSSDRYTFSVGGRMTTALADDWLQTVYVEMMHEDYSVGTTSDTATPLIPGISWERIKRSNPHRIREGSLLKLELSGAPVDFSNGSLFTQAHGSAFFITSPWEKGRILARTELGATLAEDRDRLSVSHRFFAGGDRSVRGYKFESLGPKNAQGEVVGGTYLFVASLEYEHLVAEDWALAAFADTGNAYYDTLDSLYTGVGLGLRWFSPIGPIKLDLAHPLQDSGNDIRIHVGIGPEF